MLPRLCRAPLVPCPPLWSLLLPSPCSLCPPSPLPHLCLALSLYPLLQLRSPRWVWQPQGLQGLPQLAQYLQDSRLQCHLAWLLLLQGQ